MVDLSGLVTIKALENALPLIDVIEKLLELVYIDRSARVLVKDIWKRSRRGEVLVYLVATLPAR